MSTKIAVVVSLVILLAAVPAMAGHDLGLSYQLNFINSNFNGSETGNGWYTPEGLDASPPYASFFEQRARLSWTGTANDDLKLVTMFEVDYSYWGDSSYEVGSDSGGAIGSDQVNLETKHVYLSFNLGPVTINAGMQPLCDAFKGIIIDSDVAGLLVSGTYGNFSDSVGFFRLLDDGDVPGDQTADLLVLDGKLQVSDALAVGGAYYYLDIDDVATVNVLGANVAGAAGPVNYSGFLVYEFGSADETDLDISSFAANVGLSAAAGPGTIRAEFLYTAGDDDADDDTDNAFLSVFDEAGFYGNEMVIISLDKYALTAENAIVYLPGMQAQGVMLVSAGYDMAFGRLGCSANAGAAWVNEAPADRAGDMLATEINAEVNYKIYENLTGIIRGAYAILGDYYDGVAAGGDDPDNPYDLKAILAYTF